VASLEAAYSEAPADARCSRLSAQCRDQLSALRSGVDAFELMAADEAGEAAAEELRKRRAAFDRRATPRLLRTAARIGLTRGLARARLRVLVRDSALAAHKAARDAAAAEVRLPWPACAVSHRLLTAVTMNSPCAPAAQRAPRRRRCCRRALWVRYTPPCARPTLRTPFTHACFSRRDDAGLAASAEDATASLRRTRALMAAELGRGDATRSALGASTAKLRRTHTEFAGQRGLLAAGRTYLGKLTRSASAGMLIVWGGLAVFLLVVAHITTKRVPGLAPLNPAYHMQRRSRAAAAAAKAAAAGPPTPAAKRATPPPPPPPPPSPVVEPPQEQPVAAPVGEAEAAAGAAAEQTVPPAAGDAAPKRKRKPKRKAADAAAGEL
jgi:hypothetical protein